MAQVAVYVRSYTAVRVCLTHQCLRAHTLLCYTGMSNTRARKCLHTYTLRFIALTQTYVSARLAFAYTPPHISVPARITIPYAGAIRTSVCARIHSAATLVRMAPAHGSACPYIHCILWHPRKAVSTVHICCAQTVSARTSTQRRECMRVYAYTPCAHYFLRARTPFCSYSTLYVYNVLYRHRVQKSGCLCTTLTHAALLQCR